jgi:hypothetical protein
MKNGQCVVSDGAALGKEELAARAFVGHKYDRARHRVYHFAFGRAFGPLETTAKSISAAKLLTKDEARRIAGGQPRQRYASHGVVGFAHGIACHDTEQRRSTYRLPVVLPRRPRNTARTSQMPRLITRFSGDPAALVAELI